MANRREVIISAFRWSSILLAGGAISLFAARRKVPAAAAACLQAALKEDETNWEPLASQEPAPLKFPLAAVKGQRFLKDADGHPFLIFGDSAWSLIAQLTREDAELYLEDRRRKGFNAVLVNLIEHMYADHAPRNAYGESPFLEGSDFSKPNPRYFDHAEWVLRRAAGKGLAVLLAPAYTGAGGGAEGWYQEMVANGPEKLSAYGDYVGNRFKELNNIIWVHNGDYNPPQKQLVQAVANKIRATQPQALHVAHNAPETSGFDYWTPDELQLQIDTIYTYRPVAKSAFRPATGEAVPYFLIESTYENNEDGTALRVRSQAWQAVLAGAAGQIFGNNPIWYFNAPAVATQPMDWRKALDSAGTLSCVHLRNFLLAWPWPAFEPDIEGRLLVDGAESDFSRAVAARTADGKVAVIYIPTPRRITVDLSQVAGARVACRWFDPSAGRFLATQQQFATGAAQAFEAPVCSADGDWVLLLSSAPEA